VPEAERPNGRVAEGRATRMRGVALTTLLGATTFELHTCFIQPYILYYSYERHSILYKRN